MPKRQPLVGQPVRPCAGLHRDRAGREQLVNGGKKPSVGGALTPDLVGVEIPSKQEEAAFAQIDADQCRRP